MTELPHGWASTTLGEIAETRLGKMLSAKARTGNGGRAYLRNKNVQWGRLDLDDVFRMDFSDAEFEKFRLREGDLLVCEGGEVGRAAIWRGQLPECAYQKALHRVRPRGGVQPEFLLYLFMHYSHARRFDEYVTGSTIKHLPQEDVRLLPVPLPPLGEQRRIVAAIEEQLSRLDAAETTLEACRKRLVALERQVRAALDTCNGSRKTLAEILSDAPLFTDGDWVESKDQDPNGDVRLIQLADVGEGTFRNRSHRYLTSAAAARLRCTYLEPGDILVARMPDPLGRACIFPGVNQPSVTAVDVCIIRPPAEIDPRWLVNAINAPGAREQIAGLQSGTTRKRISRKNLATVSVHVPPLADQRRLATHVEEQLSAIRAMHGAVEGAKRRSPVLRRSILARAFRGELVPHDPNDELASVLLEQIAVERAAPALAPLRRGCVQAGR